MIKEEGKMGIRSAMWGLNGMCLVLAMSVGVSVVHAETESSKARGGQLYDNWYAVTGAKAPASMHRLYPADRKYAAKPKSNWRCKECHGWDYMGANGAYKSGKHATGIKGIDGHKGRDPAEIVSLLKGAEHDYGDKLSDADFQDLATFISVGQVNMDKHIDRATKRPIGGDSAKGAAYYNTMCAQCHGKEGKQPKGMKSFGKQMGNPWEVMHKILNGQPDSEMPALRALERQVVVDIMSHLATLPE
jgi:thiosulfate dehydrogenase